IQIKNLDWSVPKGEIAYLLDREAEGRGYMTETFEAILRVAFGELGLGKLFLRAIVGNERSARLARKFGFTREGVLREEFATHDGRRVDLEYYGVLPREVTPPVVRHMPRSSHWHGGHSQNRRLSAHHE